MLQKYRLFPELLDFEAEALTGLQCRTMPVIWKCYHNGSLLGLVFCRVHRGYGNKEWDCAVKGKVFGPYSYERDAVRKLYSLECLRLLEGENA